MKTFSDLKKAVYGVIIQDPTKESKYGKFLDKRVLEDNRRGRDKSWDLWYFSGNTEFCRESAKNFLEEIEKHFDEHKKFGASLKIDTPTNAHEFRVDRLRRYFGCFCFYIIFCIGIFCSRDQYLL